MRYFILLASFSLLLSAHQNGCGGGKNMTSGDAAKSATKVRPSSFLLKKLADRDLSDVKRINAEAKIFTQGNGQSFSANANLIWIKDSVMWLNIKKFGIEVARVLITPDSIVTLNRLEKTVNIQAFSTLENRYNLPGGFGLLQQTLLASAWVPEGMQLQSDTIDGKHRLRGNNGQLGADYRLQEGNFLLSQASFLQQKESRLVSLTFENYKKVPEAQWFPYLRHMETESPENGDMRLEIEFSDVEINVPKNYRFEIPAHYERVE